MCLDACGLEHRDNGRVPRCAATLTMPDLRDQDCSRTPRGAENETRRAMECTYSVRHRLRHAALRGHDHRGHLLTRRDRECSLAKRYLTRLRVRCCMDSVGARLDHSFCSEFDTIAGRMSCSPGIDSLQDRLNPAVVPRGERMVPCKQEACDEEIALFPSSPCR